MSWRHLSGSSNFPQARSSTTHSYPSLPPGPFGPSWPTIPGVISRSAISAVRMRSASVGPPGGSSRWPSRRMTDSTLLRFSQAQFDEIIRANPEVGWAAAKALSGILDQVLGELARVAFRTVRIRVAHHLLALTESGELTAIHQAELASAVGSVREVIGRSASTLRDEGLVTLDHAGVTPLDEWVSGV